jgi:hypothetical protein
MHQPEQRAQQHNGLCVNYILDEQRRSPVSLDELRALANRRVRASPVAPERFSILR